MSGTVQSVRIRASRCRESAGEAAKSGGDHQRVVASVYASPEGTRFTGNGFIFAVNGYDLILNAHIDVVFFFHRLRRHSRSELRDLITSPT